jgi:DNA-binding response OmpR family regulator
LLSVQYQSGADGAALQKLRLRSAQVLLRWPKGSLARAGSGDVNQYKIDGSGRRILVIDDDLAIRVLLEAVLTRVKFQVATAADGEAGLSMLDGNSYDLILLDLMMPKIDGYEFLRRVHEQKTGEKPHIIVFTAAGQRGIDKIPPDTVCASILKPFDLETFLELIESCLRGHERAAISGCSAL